MAEIKLSKAVRDQINKLAMPQVKKSAEAIERACNEQSSWDFYRTYHHDDASRVAALNAGDNARSNRLVRNADRGRV